MPVTMSYDLTGAPIQDRNYLRSMLERFHWNRLGGSVFRYDGIAHSGTKQEDWLNHIVPALMFFRSYILSKNLKLKFFTVDASSTSFLDHSDPKSLFGTAPEAGPQLPLASPTNTQSAESTIRTFVDQASQAAGAPAP